MCALDFSDPMAVPPRRKATNMPRAFVTGITGQDGQHLAEFLHGKGYEVFGMVKGQNNPRMVQMRDEFPYVEPVPGDLADLRLEPVDHGGEETAGSSDVEVTIVADATTYEQFAPRLDELVREFDLVSHVRKK